MNLHLDLLSLRVEESSKGPEMVLYTGIGASGRVLSRTTVKRVRKFATDVLSLCDDIEKHYDVRLDSCPFCGGRARPNWDYPQVVCTECSAGRGGKTLDEAIINWNRRVRP